MGGEGPASLRSEKKLIKEMATEKNEMEKEIQNESKPCVKVILTLLLLTSTFLAKYN